LCANAFVADLGMNAVCEINPRRAYPKLLNVALGSKHINRLGDHLFLDRFKKLLWVGYVLHQITQPRDKKAVFLIDVVFFLVPPVRCNALFGKFIHVTGTNLEFHMVSSRTDYCSMERLVHVRLGKAYKILEPAGNKRPERMEDAQYIVAVAHRVRDDPYSDNILHLLKRDLLFNHLLVNAVIMLDPALYLNGNVRQLELFRDDVLHLTDIAVLLLFAFRNLFFKLAEQIGHKSLEAQVLELRPHPANTEPVSEGSI